MMKLTKEVLQPFPQFIGQKPQRIVEEASCITFDINESLSLIFKARSEHCLTVRIQQYQYVDWSRYQLQVRELISHLESLALELDFTEIEFESSRRTTLLKILVQQGYNNRYGGVRGNGLEGRYVKMLVQ
ncbi:hypothetical protein P4637_10760 [Halalkalibacterium halodurans]|jgi:hypothetical protein|uniref:BH0504 protein n=2 Tax=Halalkalibacterium halodurans TaxID=86665 RepID=Q9KFH5_HALH5|nr:hypothetical protein [Halalkalibacterium halodurans]MDY7221002.1 hypothetical protein [Halalkalibacterium halodurans]MDY7240241.1 hypothetical protein [Halalkalibacterium halodurans]MED3645896.1 hypothetical protein [Halalkalibacterium halodurans]MED4079892.1 hypothetical protein [Halalkalibacterium halodurans]MED4085289.1 hypothetical protein [Halalkalibacterium halodurans]